MSSAVGTDIELVIRFRAVGIDSRSDFCRGSLFPDIPNPIVTDEDGSSAGASGGGDVEIEADLHFQRDITFFFQVFRPGSPRALDGNAEIFMIGKVGLVGVDDGDRKGDRRGGWRSADHPDGARDSGSEQG